MAGPTAVEQDGRARLDPWVAGNTAQALMVRLSKGIIKLDGYAQAVATAYADSSPVFSPIDSSINFPEGGPIQYTFENLRIPKEIEEGGRTMFLEIRESDRTQIEIYLANKYRRGLGFYEGDFSIVDHGPTAERLPINTLDAEDRIREIFDRYLPLETQIPRTMRDDAFIGDSLAQ